MPMDRLRLLLDDFSRVLERFEEALFAGSAPFACDSAILHFELCYEVAWKSSRAYAVTQGLQPAGPRESFAALVTLGLAHDEQVLTQILRARNDAVHIYRLPLADALRVTLPAFSVEFRKLHDGIRSHSGLMR